MGPQEIVNPGASQRATFPTSPARGAGMTPNQWSGASKPLTGGPDIKSAISNPGRYGMMMRLHPKTGICSFEPTKASNNVTRNKTMMTGFTQTELFQHYSHRNLP